MTTQLVITAVGPDRPGLVSALSDVIARHGGNWLDTRMGRLAGQFTGILLVEVEDDGNVDALRAALQSFGARGMQLVVQRGEAQTATIATAGSVPDRRLRFDLTAQDRPGIVRDISKILAEHGINVLELETSRESGSFSGEAMFHARIESLLPDTLDVDAVRAELESLATELMLDLTIDKENDPHV